MIRMQFAKLKSNYVIIFEFENIPKKVVGAGRMRSLIMNFGFATRDNKKFIPGPVHSFSHSRSRFSIYSTYTYVQF